MSNCRNKGLLILLFASITLPAFVQDTIHLKTYYGDLKSVDISINGKNYDFLFDAGGGETFISPAIAKLLNKEIYGSSAGFRMSGELIRYRKADNISIKMGATEIFHQTIGVWNVMDILPKDFPRLDGVLSLKSFGNNILTIDLSRNILVIESKTSSAKQIRTKSLLPARFATGPDGGELTIFIGIPRNNNMYWFLFDTGNIGPVILSLESAVLWGLQFNLKDSVISDNKIELVLGKNKIETDAYPKKIIYDGALNFETISRHVFTIDFRKRKIWMN